MPTTIFCEVRKKLANRENAGNQILEMLKS